MRAIIGPCGGNLQRRTGMKIEYSGDKDRVLIEHMNPGSVIEWNDKLWLVVEWQPPRPFQYKAIARLEDGFMTKIGFGDHCHPVFVKPVSAKVVVVE